MKKGFGEVLTKNDESDTEEQVKKYKIQFNLDNILQDKIDNNYTDDI